MSLTPGTRVGAYQVTAHIGEGGMGEVYRATDTVLGRSVAIKILPESFASDPERLARFELEAKTLASLNHPNIAQIYGFEKANDIPALVMELVEGPTLAERLAGGAMPIAEALEVAKQMADGLEAAHEKGIVHRDLKPANVKITLQGTVKILDFGLAAVTRGSAPNDVSATHSPTLMLATSAGVIMGTVAYMSPEQASGKPVDKRADIWAFGVVLWEMLTGKRLFEGETASHTMAFVLTKEPDWAVLPPSIPEPVRRMLRRCLEKAPRRRLADIADARFEIETVAQQVDRHGIGVPAESATTARPHRGTLDRVVGLVAGIALTMIAVYGWLRFAPGPRSEVVRFTIDAPSGQSIQISNFDRDAVISPDGTRIVFVATGEGGRRQIMVRALDQLAAVPIHDISSASIALSLFISPDSRWVGFFESGELKKVPITGGAAISLCKVNGNPRGASWGVDNTIVFATSGTASSDSSAFRNTGLLRVSAGGGEPQVLTEPDARAGELDHVFPSVLPDGRAALFLIVTGDANRSRVAIVDFSTSKYSVVIREGGLAKYLPSGHLIYASAGSLFAVPFDPQRLAVKGDPLPVLDRLMTVTNGAASFDVASNGTMVFIPGAANQTAKRVLVWVDRQGREQPINAPARAYVSPRLSPDNTRIAVDSRDQQEDIWLYDLARQTLTPLTNDPRLDQRPLWTSDGARIIFSSLRSGRPRLYSQAADGTGTAEELSNSDSPQNENLPAAPSSITPDGTQVVVDGGSAKGSLIALRPVRKEAGDRRQATPLIEGVVNLRNGEVSPDGRWIAYQSNESNESEVYLRPFPNVNGGRWRISLAGGIKPAWARNSRELFYLDASDALMSVSIEASGSPPVRNNPRKVFDARPYLVRTGFTMRTYDVSNDGQRFLMVKDASAGDSGAATGPTTITVVMNWLEELKRLMPTN